MTYTALELVPIEIVRKHLRLDHDADDDLIELYAESALAWALWYCDNSRLAEAANVKASFKAALLLLIGHSYEAREAVAVGVSVESLPLAVESLLWSSRDFRGPSEETAP